MQLARFLNNIFKNDGFILLDANSKKFIIGSPKKKNKQKMKCYVMSEILLKSLI